MLTDDQIAELKRLEKWRVAGLGRRSELNKALADAVPALLDERDLLMTVAEAAEGCSHLYYVNNAVGLKRLHAALAAWRAARDGGKETK